jgi:hypothetical protein
MRIYLCIEKCYRAIPPSTYWFRLVSNLDAGLKKFYKWLKNSRALKSCSTDVGEVETEDQEVDISHHNQSDQKTETSKINQSDRAKISKENQSDQEAET